MLEILTKPWISRGILGVFAAHVVPVTKTLGEKNIQKNIHWNPSCWDFQALFVFFEVYPSFGRCWFWGVEIHHLSVEQALAPDHLPQPGNRPAVASPSHSSIGWIVPFRFAGWDVRTFLHIVLHMQIQTYVHIFICIQYVYLNVPPTPHPPSPQGVVDVVCSLY